MPRLPPLAGRGVYPRLARMIIELGHFALILAALIAVLQAVVPMVGAQRGWRGWMAFAEPAATSQAQTLSKTPLEAQTNISS